MAVICFDENKSLIISCLVHFNDVISTLYFHLPPDTKSKTLLNLILLSNYNTVSLYKCGKISLLANFIEGEHLICIDFTNNNNHKYLQLSFLINTLYVSYIFKYSDNENSTQSSISTLCFAKLTSIFRLFILNQDLQWNSSRNAKVKTVQLLKAFQIYVNKYPLHFIIIISFVLL